MFLKYLIPVPLKKSLKYIYGSLLDLKDSLTGKRDKRVPPRRLNFVGSLDFLKVANEFFEYFKRKDIGYLKPHEKVLDIGCGVGRMAIPLTNYLNDEGEYQGFDIDKRGVDWCHKNLTKRYANFHFKHADIYNKYYNQKGQLQSSSFTFPYDDETFDFAFATSVFTHMFEEDVRHYLNQVHRVLKKDGRALVTFFAVDEQAKKNIETGLATCKLIYPHGEAGFYSHKEVPEAEIGFKAEWIEETIQSAGLSIVNIFYGSWSGRANPLSYQDIYLLKVDS